MKPLKDRYWRKYFNEERLSRKVKKHILGKKMSRKKLTALLKSVVLIEHDKYSTEILPFEFCPKCGCTKSNSSGGMAEYPERWEQYHCARCNFLVCESDNGPYVHALQCKEDNYKLN